MAWVNMFIFKKNFLPSNLNSLCGIVFQQNSFCKSVPKSQLLPERPKRPSNVFILYFKKIETDLSQKFPNKNRKELMKESALLYKNISPSEKEKLNEEYAVLLKEYYEKLKEYQESLTPEQLELLKKPKNSDQFKVLQNATSWRKKHYNVPRPPMSAFLKFVSEERAKSTDELSATEFIKKSAERWKNLPESEKKKYLNEFKEERKKFEIELVKWEMKMLKEGCGELLRQKTLKSLASPKTKKKNDE